MSGAWVLSLILGRSLLRLLRPPPSLAPPLPLFVFSAFSPCAASSLFGRFAPFCTRRGLRVGRSARLVGLSLRTLPPLRASRLGRRLRSATLRARPFFFFWRAAGGSPGSAPPCRAQPSPPRPLRLFPFASLAGKQTPPCGGRGLRQATARAPRGNVFFSLRSRRRPSWAAASLRSGVGGVWSFATVAVRLFFPRLVPAALRAPRVLRGRGRARVFLIGGALRSPPRRLRRLPPSLKVAGRRKPCAVAIRVADLFDRFRW